MPGEELPPVIAPVQADIRQLIQGLLEARRAVEDGVGEVNVPFEPDIAPVEAAAKAVAAQRFAGPTFVPQMDIGALLAKEAVVRSLPAWASAAQGNLGWDFNIARWRQMSGPTGGQFATNAMLAELARSLSAEQKAAIPAAALAAIAEAGGGGRGGGGGFGLAAGAAGGDRGGFLSALIGAKGIGGGGSLLGALAAALYGGGRFGLAGTGSILGLAGLGPEHAIMTGIGLAGSLSGALLGGGLLAAGAGAVAGVGMGTDLAGIGQAAGDIKTVYGDMNNLSQAVALYGKNSAQATQAQAQLNYDLAGFSAAARPAVVQAADAAIKFKAMFDAWTGPAEATGANIITQLMQTAQQFIPTIGIFAAENMKIIQQGLQPLLQWLQTGGLAIFTNLEYIFQRNLPTAMDTFNNAVQFVIKTLGYLGEVVGSGGLLGKIDAFFQKMNTAGGFATWVGQMDRLIGLFHTWYDFFSIVVKDIYQIFHADAGTGQAIVTTLTQMLTHLHDWLQSTTGQADLHTVFEVHKQEVLTLLQLLPPLVTSLGQVELIATPQMTAALTMLVRDGLLPLIHAISSLPGGSFVLGLALLSRMGPLSGLFSSFGRVGWAAISAGITALGAATGTLTAAGAASLVTYGDAIAGLVAGFAAYKGTTSLLDLIFGKPGGTHPSTALTPQTTAWIKAYDKSIVTDAARGLISVAAAQPIELPPPHLDAWQRLKVDIGNWWHDVNAATMRAGTDMANGIDRQWQGIDRDTRHWFGDVESFFKGVWDRTSADARQWGDDVYAALDSGWQHTDTSTRHWFGDVESFFRGTWDRVSADARQWGNDVYSTLDGAWQRVDTDTRHWFGNVETFLSGLWSRVRSDATTAGRQVWQTLDSAWQKAYSGVTSTFGRVESFFKGLPAAIMGFLRALPDDMLNLGQQVVSQFIKGLKSLTGGSGVGGILGSVLNGIFGGIPGVVNKLLGNHSPSSLMFDAGKNLMQGLTNGIVAHTEAAVTAATAAAAKVGGSFAGIQNLGQGLAASLYGWTGAQWAALNQIVMMESGWNPTAQNPHSSAYGIAQNIGGPGGYGAYGDSAQGQILWMLNYIRTRYGNPEAALAFHLAHGWYAGGTPYASGGWAMLGEQGPELVNLPRGSRVLSNSQSMAALGGGGDIQINLIIDSKKFGSATVNATQAALLRKKRMNVRVV